MATLAIQTIDDNSNGVTSENKRMRTHSLSPPFKVGMFVVFYR